MERDFETVMIEQCAPVLAGLKPAGLFRYETRNRADLARRVAGWNADVYKRQPCSRATVAVSPTFTSFSVFIVLVPPLQYFMQHREGAASVHHVAACHGLIQCQPALLDLHDQVAQMCIRDSP